MVVGATSLVLLLPLALIITGNAGGAVLNSLLNRQPTRQELIGSYQYRARWGTVFLQINPNGSFLEEFHETGHPQRRVNGTWQARSNENYLDVEFQPFGNVDDEDHAHLNGKSGMPFFKPFLGIGKTYGLIDDDLGEKFEQQ